MKGIEDRRIKCIHPDYLSSDVFVDFGELWVGRREKRSKKARGWAGEYTGRPGLANDLFPTLKASLQHSKPQRIRGALSVLRSFWRYLDAYENCILRVENCNSIARVDSVSSIGTIHGVRWMSPVNSQWIASSPTHYRNTNAWIQRARKLLGLELVFWPPIVNSEKDLRDDVPSKEQGIRLIRLLSAKAHAIWKRWERADSLAETGRNLLDFDRNDLSIRRAKKHGGFTEADAHATFRSIIRITGDPMPDISKFNSFFGNSTKSVPNWWPRYSDGHAKAGQFVKWGDMLAALYPSTEDLHVLYCLFLLRSGWNPATAYALDCSSDSSWSEAYGEELRWIHSYKERGNSWQDTVSPKNHSTHCFQIILRLLERTRPLRLAVKENRAPCGLPAIAERSPWIGFAWNSKDVKVIDEHSQSSATAALRGWVGEYNNFVEMDGLILPKFKLSDFRDIFAEAVHRDGNYSMFLTQLALGHKRIGTTRRYLRSLAWRKESEGKLNELFYELIGQIEVHRKIDITILRAKMDGLDISEEQIGRLESYRLHRAYSGLGCASPQNPPDWIDPSNPRDGTVTCVQGHRCPACPHGRVFDDSLPHLARYTAELEWKRKQYGEVKWYQSTDSLDLEVYQATLAQWPKFVVDKELEAWRNRIEKGDHKVLILSGGRN